MQKRCKRKIWPLVNPINSAILGACIPSESRLDKLRIRELSAIESFAKGNATPADFRDVCDLINVAETMSESGIGPEAMEWCEKSQAALMRIKDAYEECGRMILRAEELNALHELYAWHDAQRTAVDLSTYERAIQRTANKIRSAHPKVRVIV